MVYITIYMIEAFLLKGNIIPSQFLCEYHLYIGFYITLNFNLLYILLVLTFIYFLFVVLAITIKKNVNFILVYLINHNLGY